MLSKRLAVRPGRQAFFLLQGGKQGNSFSGNNDATEKIAAGSAFAAGKAVQEKERQSRQEETEKQRRQREAYASSDHDAGCGQEQGGLFCRAGDERAKTGLGMGRRKGGKNDGQTTTIERSKEKWGTISREQDARAENNLSAYDQGQGCNPKSADAAILEHGAKSVAGFPAAQCVRKIGQTIQMQSPGEPYGGENIEPGLHPGLSGKKAESERGTEQSAQNSADKRVIQDRSGEFLFSSWERRSQASKKTKGQQKRPDKNREAAFAASRWGKLVFTQALRTAG